MRGKCGIDAIATPPDPHRHTVSRLIANKVGDSEIITRTVEDLKEVPQDGHGDD
jgi:hypothetical protein